MYYVSLALFLPGVSLYLTSFLLCTKWYANEQKCKQCRQRESPYRETLVVDDVIVRTALNESETDTLNALKVKEWL